MCQIGEENASVAWALPSAATAGRPVTVSSGQRMTRPPPSPGLWYSAVTKESRDGASEIEFRQGVVPVRSTQAVPAVGVVRYEPIIGSAQACQRAYAPPG